jgi:hypothetical protein
VGGNILEPPGEEPPRPSDRELAAELIDIILTTVEPPVWLDPEVASIRFSQGLLIVRAPEYVQRQIAGYPRREP